MLALALAVSSLVVPQAPTSRRGAVASAAAFASLSTEARADVLAFLRSL